jgi:hypothetical protein
VGPRGGGHRPGNYGSPKCTSASEETVLLCGVSVPSFVFYLGVGGAVLTAIWAVVKIISWMVS